MGLYCSTAFERPIRLGVRSGIFTRLLLAVCQAKTLTGRGGAAALANRRITIQPWSRRPSRRGVVRVSKLHGIAANTTRRWIEFRLTF